MDMIPSEHRLLAEKVLIEIERSGSRGMEQTKLQAMFCDTASVGAINVVIRGLMLRGEILHRKHRYYGANELDNLPC